MAHLYCGNGTRNDQCVVLRISDELVLQKQIDMFLKKKKYFSVLLKALDFVVRFRFEYIVK